MCHRTKWKDLRIQLFTANVEKKEQPKNEWKQFTQRCGSFGADYVLFSELITMCIHISYFEEQSE